MYVYYKIYPKLCFYVFWKLHLDAGLTMRGILFSSVDEHRFVMMTRVGSGPRTGHDVFNSTAILRKSA